MADTVVGGGGGAGGSCQANGRKKKPAKFVDERNETCKGRLACPSIGSLCQETDRSCSFIDDRHFLSNGWLTLSLPVCCCCCFSLLPLKSTSDCKSNCLPVT